jgi:lipid-A-disaccharide synthase
MQVNPELAAKDPGAPVIALVAGELSGDQLGAALIATLKERFPQARFAGIGGAGMKAQGLDAWWDCDELAVMGLAEVVSHLPRLLRLRKELGRRLLDLKPDVMIGIDAPDFNLGLEKRLRKEGITTVHYVSPTVWAWRSGRVKSIGAAADMVMCLFPFEPDFYRSYDVAAQYTGHPMADEISNRTPDRSDKTEARLALGLDPDAPCIALLPGSRRGEVGRMSPHMLGAAARLSQHYPGMQFVAAMASTQTRQLFDSALRKHGAVQCKVTDGQARLAISAADLVICASGTATLETMLINRPMVVVYRVSYFTYALIHGLKLFKSRFFSLPNILAGEEWVPELRQYQANAEQIAAECTAWLDDPDRCARVQRKFTELHSALRKDAAQSAADCVQTLLRE